MQFQASNVWVGLSRTCYGAGLQYNQQTQAMGKPLAVAVGYDFDYSKERRTGGTASAGE